MDSMQILGLVGGISRDSINRRLYEAVRSMAPRNLVLETTEISLLPFFSQDIENDPPKSVRDLKEKVKSAGGILVITPEYNRSFPGVLKNALDWGSRPYGQSVWDKKPVAVMGASIGNIGTFGAQNHLRQVLAYLNMPTMEQPEFYLNASKAFDESGKLIDSETQEHIRKFWHAFGSWISNFQA